MYRLTRRWLRTSDVTGQLHADTKSTGGIGGLAASSGFMLVQRPRHQGPLPSRTICDKSERLQWCEDGHTYGGAGSKPTLTLLRQRGIDMADPAALQERIDLLEEELRTVHAQVDMLCRYHSRGCRLISDAARYHNTIRIPPPSPPDLACHGCRLKRLPSMANMPPRRVTCSATFVICHFCSCARVMPYTWTWSLLQAMHAPTSHFRCRRWSASAPGSPTKPSHPLRKLLSFRLIRPNSSRWLLLDSDLHGWHVPHRMASRTYLCS